MLTEEEEEEEKCVEKGSEEEERGLCWQRTGKGGEKEVNVGR